MNSLLRLTCHTGANWTLSSIKQRFWWPGIGQDVKEFVASCSVSSCGNSSHRPPAGLLQTLPVPGRPWSHIAVDFITGLPPSEGNTVFLGWNRPATPSLLLLPVFHPSWLPMVTNHCCSPPKEGVLQCPRWRTIYAVAIACESMLEKPCLALHAIIVCWLTNITSLLQTTTSPTTHLHYSKIKLNIFSWLFLLKNSRHRVGW